MLRFWDSLGALIVRKLFISQNIYLQKEKKYHDLSLNKKVSEQFIITTEIIFFIQIIIIILCRTYHCMEVSELLKCFPTTNQRK